MKRVAGVEHVAVVPGARHELAVVGRIVLGLRELGHGVVVEGVFQGFRHAGLALGFHFGAGYRVGGDVTFLNVLFNKRARAAFLVGVAQQQAVDVGHIVVAQAALVGPGDEGGGVVAVEEGGDEAGFVADVLQRLNHVGRDVGGQHAQQHQLIAVGVPERGDGVVAEVGLHHGVLRVAVLAVDVAAQRRPQKGAVEGRCRTAASAWPCRRPRSPCPAAFPRSRRRPAAPRQTTCRQFPPPGSAWRFPRSRRRCRCAVSRARSHRPGAAQPAPFPCPGFPRSAFAPAHSTARRSRPSAGPVSWKPCTAVAPACSMVGLRHPLV